MSAFDRTPPPLLKPLSHKRHQRLGGNCSGPLPRQHEYIITPTLCTEWSTHTCLRRATLEHTSLPGSSCMCPFPPLNVSARFSLVLFFNCFNLCLYVLVCDYLSLVVFSWVFGLEGYFGHFASKGDLVISW